MPPEDIVYASVGTLTKSKTEDGVLTFEASKATGPDLDGDGQRVDMAWAVPAMREWFATGGNLREQHDAKRAIGKALTLEERSDGVYISGKVVDPVAIMKIQHGVLSDLSIGVKNHKIDYTNKAAAPGGWVVGGRIVEVTLADRGSNPTTKLVLAKAAAPDGHLESVAEVIEAEPVADPVVPDVEKPDPDAEKAEDVDALAKLLEKVVSLEAEVDAVKAAVAKFPSIEIGDSDKAAKPTKADPDPDDDGDDDTTPSGDTDHDFYNADGSLTAKGKASGLKAKAEEPDVDAMDLKTLQKALGIDPETMATQGGGIFPSLIKSMTAEPDAVKALQAAVGFDSEAQSKLLEEVTSLKADLEKVMGMSIPGAVRARPAGARAMADARSALEVQRDHYRRLADTAQDQTAYAGYMAKADRLDESFKKITE